MENKYCPYCGHEVNMNADVCLNCGKNIHLVGVSQNKFPWWGILLIVLASLASFIILTIMFFSVAYSDVKGFDIKDIVHDAREEIEDSFIAGSIGEVDINIGSRS